MKKLSSVLLLLVVVLVFLCGCTQTSNPKNENHVTIWHDKEEVVIDVLSNALKEALPELTIVFEKKSNLTEALKLVGNDAKVAPDLYFFAHDKMGVYAEMGILSPISDFVSQDMLQDHLSFTLAAATYQDTLYQLPLYFETLLFMCNAKYMTQDEVPKTTEELLAYMDRKTKYGHYGFVEQHSTPYYASAWIHAFSGEIITKDGTPDLNTQSVKDALAYHLKFVNYMPGETEYATVNTLFLEGKAHSTIAGPWFVPTVLSAGIDMQIAPMPIVDATGIPLSPYSGVQGVHVLKARAKVNGDNIQKVLEALLEPQISVDLALASGCAPAQNACYEQEVISNNPLVMTMKETAQNALPMPNLPQMDVMWSVVGNLLTDVNMRNADVDKACNDAQKKALDLIEAMK